MCWARIFLCPHRLLEDLFAYDVTIVTDLFDAALHCKYIFRASYKLSFAKRRCSYKRWIKGARHFVKEVPNSISPVEENGELKMIKCFPFSIQVFL